jgi:hypothetical protein
MNSFTAPNEYIYSEILQRDLMFDREFIEEFMDFLDISTILVYISYYHLAVKDSSKPNLTISVNNTNYAKSLEVVDFILDHYEAGKMIKNVIDNSILTESLVDKYYDKIYTTLINNINVRKDYIKGYFYVKKLDLIDLGFISDEHAVAYELFVHYKRLPKFYKQLDATKRYFEVNNFGVINKNKQTKERLRFHNAKITKERFYQTTTFRLTD